MCLCVRNVCVQRQQQIQKQALLTTRYFWHADKALEAIRVNNIQQTGEACLVPLASPLWFDKILLATTSHRLGLQTVTYCSGNHCGKRQAVKFISDHTSSSIYL